MTIDIDKSGETLTDLRDVARTIFTRALAETSVDEAMARAVSVRDEWLSIAEERFDLRAVRRVRIVAAGKAGATMLAALLSRLPAGIDISGVVIAPVAPVPLPNGFEFFAGGHPMPDEHSFAAARAALEITRAAAADPKGTLCLFLISGGTSAMMELPLDPAISLAETAEFHRTLVASGAPIAEMNCVRKHFSAVKGGRLAQAAGAARCCSLLVSDVPEARRDALGSGPTVADSSTVAECRVILTRYGMLERFPAAVRRFFERDDLPETPKPGELAGGECVLLDAGALAGSAARAAEALGWTAVIDNSCDEWEYREAASYLLNRLRGLRKDHARVCLISAGEVIVALPPDCRGAGGRNQQFALYAATLLGPGEENVTILSAGSDGIDGNSPAAGAVVDGALLREPAARAAALRALEEFHAHPLLADAGAAITTGPTGNNLRDLRILLAE